MKAHVTNTKGKEAAGRPPVAPVTAPEAPGPEARHLRGSVVVFKTRDGAEGNGTILRLTRHTVAFELCNPAILLRTSEVLDRFKIIIDGRTIYSGRAVVSGLIPAGTQTVGEAKLDDLGPEMAVFLQPSGTMPDLEQAYDRFFLKWQGDYRIAPEFKVQVLDIQAFLIATRRWLEQVEFDLKLHGGNPAAEPEAEILEGIARRVIASFNLQHQKFEELAYAIPPERRGEHQDFVRRHWQNLFLCTPFGHRTYHKPLGYAGDYEMMNMIGRNRPEGGSLYEKLIHLLLVSQWPAQSVRNRTAYLKENILRETARVARLGRRTRILNVGCGPARAIQGFLRESPLSNEADITLLDFNEETLAHANSQCSQLKAQHARRARIETWQISVHHLLRQSVQAEKRAAPDGYDLIYCAGLFDYLTLHTARAMVELWQGWLRPGGLLIVANMNDSKPFRNFIEFVLDWQLIYRDSQEMRSLIPAAARDQARVVVEDTTVNLFLQLRKPD